MIKKILKIFLGLLISLFLLIFITIKWSARELDGEWINHFTQDAIEVVKDQWGVPHIYAQSDSDAFYALGVQMAHDRLFQMDIWRRVAKGELSEILGKITLGQDVVNRNLGFYHYAKKHVAEEFLLYSPEVQTIFNSFLQGVNDYVANPILPFEYYLLRTKPEPFTVEDIVAFTAFMSFSFSNGLHSDSLITSLFSKYFQFHDWLNYLRKPSDSESLPDPFPAHILAKMKKVKAKTSFQHLPQHNPVIDYPWGPELVGSNSFILAAHKNSENSSILGNDPHIFFQLPGIWYEAHLKTPTTEVYGHFLPLIPLPVIGHTPEHAWGITMSMVDDLDLHQFEFHPTNENQVRSKGEWVSLSKEFSEIKIKGESSFLLEYWRYEDRFFLNGITNFLSKKVKTNEPKHRSVRTSLQHLTEDLTISWAHYQKNNLSYQSLYGILKAQNPEDLKLAIALSWSPGMNINYAFKNGDIGHQVLGGLPQRSSDYQWGDVVEWRDDLDDDPKFLAFAKNPAKINPPNGVIVTANYRDNYFHQQPGYWEPKDRHLSLENRLLSQDQWSVPQLLEIFSDDFDLSASENLPQLLAVVQQNLLKQNESNLSNEKLKGVSQWSDQLSQWDFRLSAQSTLPTLYFLWMNQLARSLLTQVMSEDEALQFCSFSRFWATFRYLLNHPETPWWAGQYEQLVTRSFIQVVQNLEKRSLSEQKWGSFHTLKLTHPLGLHPVLGQLFNLTEQSMPGGNNVVNNMKISWCQDHGKIVAGPSMRKLVITKNPEKSYGILPAGNSGRVGNQHYNDQVDLFAAGKWRELWMVSKEKLPQVRHQLLITSQKTKDKK